MFDTDLAMELRERFAGDDKEVSGVILRKETDRKNKTVITEIEIISEEGARNMGKPMGLYITIEWKDDLIKEEAICRSAAAALNKMMPEKKDRVLVIGLGNADMTADALGPRTIERLKKSRILNGTDDGVAALIPGVMSQTGMESSEIVEGIASRIKPDLIIVADALASRSALRLGRTLQITDTGICPGAGIGNRRQTISRKTTGVPVISIGIPTVVRASSIVCDAMEEMKKMFSGSEVSENILGSMSLLNSEEYSNLVNEVLNPVIGDLFVMPKDLDDTLARLSTMLSGTIERALVRS